MRGLRHLLVLLGFLALSGPLLAQDENEDRGFLARQLENALSGPGRTVRIFGFAGALSSEATIERLEIEDDQGVWLTLENVVLDWSRLSLLRGRLEVERLSADRLDIPRLPVPADTTELPDAAASGFSLPDLPVSVNIDAFEVPEIALGAPVLGEAAELGVTASARLNDDGLTTDLTARRTDGRQGDLTLSVNFGRQSNALDLDVELHEATGGLAARALGLPGTPSVDLVVAGSGPLSDFTADVALSTDGVERIAGRVGLRDEDGPDGQVKRIEANIGGDVTALVLPQYHDFFGPDVRLQLDALRRPDGSTDVSEFRLAARSLDLSGQVRVNDAMWPSFIDVTGVIVDDDGDAVLLPVGGVLVDRVDLAVDYDAANGETLTGSFDIANLVHDAATVAQARLALDGTMQGSAGSVGQLLADLTFNARGLGVVDESAGKALGSAINGKANINYIEEQPIRITGLSLTGDDYSFDGQAIIGTVVEGFPTRLSLALSAADLERFGGLAGRPLSGAADLTISGNVTPLAGFFDLAIDGTSTDLAVGVDQADALMQGRSVLSIIAERNDTGSFLRDATLDNDALRLTASAFLRPEKSEASLDFEIFDGRALAPQLEGPVRVKAEGTDEGQGWAVDAEVQAPHDARMQLSGRATGPDADLNFDLAIPRVSDFAEGIDGALSARGRAFNSPEGWQVDLSGEGPYEATLALDGLVSGPEADLDLDISVPNLEPLAPGVTGPLSIRGNARQDPQGWRVDLDVDAPYDAALTFNGLATGPDAALDLTVSVPDLQPLVPSLEGALTADGTARMTPQGWRVDLDADGPYAAKLALEGLATGPQSDIAFDLSLPDIQPLVAQLSGAVSAQGNLRPRETGLEVDMRATGPMGARLSATGTATGPQTAFDVDLAIDDIAPLAPQFPGAVTARAQLSQTDKGLMVEASATGPQQSSASVTGIATGPEADVRFSLDLASVAAFAPQIPGALTAEGRAWQSAEGWRVDVDANGPYAAELRADGLATGPDAALEFSARMPNIAPLVPQLSGPLALNGTANRTAPGWQVDTSLDGPAGTQATINGTVGDDGQLDLHVNGNAPLGLSQPFLAPRSLTGQATFDLTLNGPPALSSVSGNIRVSDADFTDPNLRLALTGVGGTIAVSGARAQIDATANLTSSGQVRVSGGIGLDTLAADLRVDLVQAEVIDPRLYRTILDGSITISGPLTGGARIAGRIDVGETLLTVPNTGLTSIGDIPPIRHLGETRPQRITRARAGVLEVEDPAAAQSASGPGYALDVFISAPGRIFVRGRGLDAELGGSLQLGGTTARVISIGSFELRRGRIDILGKRFELEEGRIEFQGDLTPYLYFVTTTTTGEGTASITLDGPADAPDVSFTSNPSLPQDEVVAQLLFGKRIDEISALQALQLANAVAVLAGRGGVSMIGRLRDSFGLDDFDVGTNAEGDTQISAGKYITDQVYSTVTSTGSDTEVSLNFDLTKSLTTKATVDAEGNTGLGIFFEKDY
ncbi:translocation/assembly module TamB domain-containing protein [Sulfitobacter sp. LCG007]